MAQMGMTFVDGINEVVETILEFPMAGTTKPSDNSDTTSVYYRAEQFVDRENKRIQAWGWPENTRIAVPNLTTDGDDPASTATPAGGGLVQFTVAGSVLKIRGSGPDQHRALVLRKNTWSSGGAQEGTFVYDADRGVFDTRTTQFHGSTSDATQETIYLDLTELLNFEYLPPSLQDVIIARSKWTFQRRMQGNMELDQSLMQEYMQAEASVLRNQPNLDQAFNEHARIPVPGQGSSGR